MIQCEKCGDLCDDGTERCRKCGRNITSTPTEPAYAPVSEFDNIDPEKEEKYKRLQRQYRYLKLRTRVAIIQSAIVLGIAGFFNGSVVFPDVIGGAIAGWLLCRMGGGKVTGMVIYLVTFAVLLAVNTYMFDSPGIVSLYVGGFMFCYGGITGFLIRQWKAGI